MYQPLMYRKGVLFSMLMVNYFLTFKINVRKVGVDIKHKENFF